MLEGEALQVLTAVDARLLEPLRAHAVSFVYRPQIRVVGTAATPALWSVRYSWRDGVGDRVDFLDAESHPCAHVPDAPVEQRAGALQQHLNMARGLAAFFRGRAHVQAYSGCRGRVERETVNGVAEVSVVLEPAERQRVARTVIRLDRRGVPWKVERSMTNGDRVLQHPQYEPRGDKFALLVLQHMETPAVTSEKGHTYAYEFKWQTVDGVLLPASVSKQSKDEDEPGLGTTEFREVRLGASVAEFEPLAPAFVR